MLRCKLFGSRQLPNLQSLRLAQLDPTLHLEDRFTTTVANVDVDRPVIVALKKGIDCKSRTLHSTFRSPDTYRCNTLEISV
jgi:hypothetical protein